MPGAGSDVRGRGVTRVHVIPAIPAGLVEATERHLIRVAGPALSTLRPGFVGARLGGLALAAADPAPVGAHGGVPDREDQEDEQALQAGGDGEQVLEHHAGVLDGEEGEHPAQTWREE